MKAIKSFQPILVPFLFLLIPALVLAHDTDLYMASGQGVEPNILIMFDNSNSMNETVQAYFYDPATLYDPLVVAQAYRNYVYRKSNNSWVLYKTSIDQVPCADGRTALNNQGHYEGMCSGTNRILQTGNYRNYLQSIGGSEFLPKVDIAKRVITEFLNTIQGVRVGAMVFNFSEGGRLQSTIKSLTGAEKTQLVTDINNIVAETWTPLAETLYEAGLYFKGAPSYFNSGVQYVSPIQFACQRNYVIIITDGESTQDRNSILASKIGDQNGDGKEPGGAHEVYYASSGSDYLDDVAKYLYDTDLSSSFDGKQNVSTYTIGFTVSSDLLERTAAVGHGKYFYCNSAQSLSSSFQNIVEDILSKTSTFVAPIVPVSRMEKTASGDKIYFALFKPVKDKMWYGNIKKFGIAQSADPVKGIQIGDIIDSDGKKAVDSDGQFLQTARSYWSAELDGGDVEIGGVGKKLMDRIAARNLYTYFGPSKNLADAVNLFSKTNNAITPSLMGLGSDTDPDAQTARNKLIDFVYGLDAYDEDGNSNTSEKRDWIVGSFLHSRPAIIQYATKTVIYAGSNDGMLHAFDDSDGSELWAFVPPNLLNKLQALHADVLGIFVDGSPKTYISRNESGQIVKAILIFGQRRGGNRYYAIDVTNPSSPQVLWEINPDATSSPYAKLGQSWSTPAIGKVALGTGEKWVAFISGGYDENQDNDNPGADSVGKVIYVVDVLTGAKVWEYSDPTQMTYSIPSDIAKIDTQGNGRIDRLYVGDMGGRMWRFDIGDAGNTSTWSGKIVFDAGAGLTKKRKIFYPPDVTLETGVDGSGNVVDYEMIFFGTGDREHPKEPTVVDRLYAVKDFNPSSPLNESNLADVTADLLQMGTAAEKSETMNLLAERKGWYIQLDLKDSNNQNVGEKCLAAPVLLNKVVYYTTFAPTSGNGSDPCFVGEGTAKVYAAQYKTGNAAMNFDLTNDDSGKTVLGKTDRSQTVGTSIPSGVVIAVINGKLVGYIGVGMTGGSSGGGGGSWKLTPNDSNPMRPVYWRMVF
jgi:type IV pilus assembly protein PilY1